MTGFRPTSAAEVASVIRWAAAEAQPLELRGGGSKRGLGRPLQVEHTLALDGLAGIVDYEPAELVLTAAAGTPLAEVESTVLARGQMLAFEPPDWGHLLDSRDCVPTLGGAVACNLAGPRRIKAGAARDHLLGFEAVNGRGEVFRAGGKVVKNVTGYDMCKLVAGSHGTLVALTELSIKVLPRPETARTIVAFGLDDAAAVVAMAAALNSPHEVSGAAHLPHDLAVAVGFGAAATLLRVEGFPPSVAHRCEAVRGLLGADTEERDDAATALLWRMLANVDLLAEPRGRPVWRISVPPAAGATVAKALAAAALFYDWGGGLIWAAMPESLSDGGAAAVRRAVAPHEGHATLVRGAAGLRASVDVFQPLDGPLAALSARVKSGFDPLGILNPGRMTAGV